MASGASLHGHGNWRQEGRGDKTGSVTRGERAWRAAAHEGRGLASGESAVM